MPVKLQYRTQSDMIKIAVALDEKGPMTKTEIAEQVEMTRAKVSALVDTMLTQRVKSHGYEYWLERDLHKRVGKNKTPAQTFRSRLTRWLY